MAHKIVAAILYVVLLSIVFGADTWLRFLIQHLPEKKAFYLFTAVAVLLLLIGCYVAHPFVLYLM